jgi:hypothetical protein
MKIIFDDKDYLDATTTFYNGCGFKPIFKLDGTVWLDVGCYLLVNLITGAKKMLYTKWRENGDQPFEIEMSPEAKLLMMSQTPCRHCGGAQYESR